MASYELLGMNSSSNGKVSMPPRMPNEEDHQGLFCCEGTPEIRR